MNIRRDTVPTVYEISLRQEVLLEKAVGVIGDMMRYFSRHNVDIRDLANPLVQQIVLLHEVKEDILTASSIEELDRLEEKIDFAEAFFQSSCDDHD